MGGATHATDAISSAYNRGLSWLVPVLLRELANKRVRQGQEYRAGLRRKAHAENTRQPRLACPIGPDDADDVPGRDCEAERVEEQAVTVAADQVVTVAADQAGGDKGGGLRKCPEGESDTPPRESEKIFTEH